MEACGRAGQALVVAGEASEAGHPGGTGFDVTEVPGIDLAVAALDRHPGLRAMVVDAERVGETMDGFTFVRAVTARWPEVAILVMSDVYRPAEAQLPAGGRVLIAVVGRYETSRRI